MATIDLMVEGLIELSIVCFADECAMGHFRGQSRPSITRKIKVQIKKRAHNFIKSAT